VCQPEAHSEDQPAEEHDHGDGEAVKQGHALDGGVLEGWSMVTPLTKQKGKKSIYANWWRIKLNKDIPLTTRKFASTSTMANRAYFHQGTRRRARKQNGFEGAAAISSRIESELAG
jgi:hypothetical protein